MCARRRRQSGELQRRRRLVARRRPRAVNDELQRRRQRPAADDVRVPQHLLRGAPTTLPDRQGTRDASQAERGAELRWRPRLALLQRRCRRQRTAARAHGAPLEELLWRQRHKANAAKRQSQVARRNDSTYL